jgi:undecaprenyl-diphosphatase
MAEESGSKSSLPLPVVLAAGLITNLAVTSVLGKLTEQSQEHKTTDIDRTGVKLVRSTKSKALNPVMSVLSAAGEPWALYPVAGLAAARWLADDRRADAATLALALTGSAGVSKLLKPLVGRPRPRFRIHRSGASGSSFPSQHIAMSVATYGALALVINRRRRQKKQGRRAALWVWAPVALLCGLIGWSRVYQGVHHPTDVLGGWVAGTIWLVTCGFAGHSLDTGKH